MPKLDIIDAHHHIWRQADQPWLNGPMVPRIFGPYDAIRRDYPITEYLADIKDNGVVASVYVQTNWDPARAVEEVAWVQEIADTRGFPHAITGFADLGGANVAAALDAMRPYPRLKGLRQQHGGAGSRNSPREACCSSFRSSHRKRLSPPRSHARFRRRPSCCSMPACSRTRATPAAPPGATACGFLPIVRMYS
jgi:predicted TIM-barrel fold metal-dependent hydrolase